MRTIADRVNKAEAALAAGFTSEAGRKEILTYYVSRAFDDVLSNAANVTGVWDVPTIANWRPKHSILFAGCPESVALANQLVDLRNRIKAATLVAKPKSKAAAQLEARAAVAKICQICGRPRGYYRDFGLCRICLRKMGHEGLIPGLRKSSW